MSTKHKRIMQGLVVLLVLSLMVNLITIVKRERNVAQMVIVEGQQTIIDSLSTVNADLEKQNSMLKQENADYGLRFDEVVTCKNETISSLRKQLKVTESKLETSTKKSTPAPKKSAKSTSSKKGQKKK